MDSILYVRLPCSKIYPGGVVALADYIHKHLPGTRQKILDLSLIERDLRTKKLIEEISSFNPEAIAFSWRDVQIFAPHQNDSSITNAFKFFYSPKIKDKIKASIDGVVSVFKYDKNIKENLNLINKSARHFPKKQIILGGPAFSVFPKQLINKVPEGTIGVIGEGEGALLKILKGEDFFDQRIMLKKNGKLIKGKNGSYLDVSQNTATDFSYISSIFPGFKEYLNDHIGIQTKRGCTQKCLFCVYRFIEGPKMRYKKPEVIGQEVSDLYHNFGVKKVWFTDATFCPNKESVSFCEQTLDEIIKSKAKIAWQGYIRIENLNPTLAKKMIDSGIAAFELSLSSGCQSIVDQLNLGFNYDDIWKACQMIKKAGHTNQPIIVNYALNAPGETIKTLNESINCQTKLESIFGKDNVQPFIFFLAVQQHTGLEKLAIKQGILKPNYNRLSLSPAIIRGLIYNPPPLDKMLAQIYLESSKKENIGKEFFERLKSELAGKEIDNSAKKTTIYVKGSDLNA